MYDYQLFQYELVDMWGCAYCGDIWAVSRHDALVSLIAALFVSMGGSSEDVAYAWVVAV